MYLSAINKEIRPSEIENKKIEQERIEIERKEAAIREQTDRARKEAEKKAQEKLKNTIDMEKMEKKAQMEKENKFNVEIKQSKNKIDQAVYEGLHQDALYTLKYLEEIDSQQSKSYISKKRLTIQIIDSLTQWYIKNLHNTPAVSDKIDQIVQLFKQDAWKSALEKLESAMALFQNLPWSELQPVLNSVTSGLAKNEAAAFAQFRHTLQEIYDLEIPSERSASKAQDSKAIPQSVFFTKKPDFHVDLNKPSHSSCPSKCCIF